MKNILPINPMIFDDPSKNIEFRPITLDGTPEGYYVTNHGDIYSTISGKFLSQYISSTGYYVTTCGIGNKVYPHRAVANEFVEGKSDLRNCVNHKNGNKLYNYDINLEWVTKGENNSHAYITGLNTYIGDNCHNAKLSNSEVEYICELLESGYEIYDILEILNMEPSMNNYEIIRSIRKGYAWKSISCKYDIKQSSYRFRKISKEDVEMACMCFENGMTIPECYEAVYNEKFLGVQNPLCKNKYITLMDIKSRKIFKDISSKYKF